MKELIINSIISQIFYFIIFLFIVGFIISLFNKLFYHLTNYNKIVLYSTSLIGTPIHELSHALMCIIFFHRIDEIKLFQISDDGVLGYVKHSYNKRNIWALIGNFFIGVAPIIGGSLLLFFVVKFLFPDTFNNMSWEIVRLQSIQEETFSINTITNILMVAWKFIQYIFSDFNLTLIIFLLIAMCISLHMNLSKQDIKGSLPSLPFILLIIVLVNIILGIISSDLYDNYLYIVNILGSFLTSSLIFSLIISLCYVIISTIIRLLIKLITKK